MSRHAALLSGDLFFASQLEGRAAAADVQLKMTDGWQRLQAFAVEQQLCATIVDLAHPAARDIESLVPQVRALSKLPIRVIAFAQHVQVERIKRARGAGCDLVTTRGEISRSLDAMLACEDKA